MDYVGHSTVAMQLHYTHVGRDRLRDIALTIDHDVRKTLGVTSFARDGRRMDAIPDLRQKKVGSVDRGKGPHQVVCCQARAVSSAGEHCAYNAGVGGSNPSPPTTRTSRSTPLFDVSGDANRRSARREIQQKSNIRSRFFLSDSA